MKLNIKNNFISLSKNTIDNIFEWEGVGDYRLEYLNDNAEKQGTKGAHSAVFRLVPENVKIFEEDYGNESVIKILKHPLTDDQRSKVMYNRFQLEIEVLYMAKEENSENIIQIKHDGIYIHENKKKYRYYIMEKADDDLNNFISKNEISATQKVVLCRDILKGIKNLHAMGFCHRDIKPDNILLTTSNQNPIWKIADLGLISKNGREVEFEFQKKIGPANWLSPEAMNKFLCEGTSQEYRFDIKIDSRSDTFQLGQILWFIFNQNAPIGQVEYDDFSHKDRRVFNLIFEMLQHSKLRRNDLANYEQKLSEIEFEYLSKGLIATKSKSHKVASNRRQPSSVKLVRRKKR